MDDTWLADMTERDRTDEPTGSGPTLSVVVPIFNEEETIPEMGKCLRAVLDSLGVSAEAIFVNDGSRDESLDHLRKLATVDPRIRVIDFSRNFGHQQALYAGICRARGDAVVLMDGDLQDPPEVIPKMVERWRAGAQVVYAVRRKRKEGLAKRLLYAIYYRLMQRLSYITMFLDSGDFSLMDRRIASAAPYARAKQVSSRSPSLGWLSAEEPRV